MYAQGPTLRRKLSEEYRWLWASGAGLVLVALLCSSQVAAAPRGATAEVEERRQVWFLKKGRELKLPFKICSLELPRRLASQVTLSADAMSLSLSEQLLGELKSLELSSLSWLILNITVGRSITRSIYFQARLSLSRQN